MPKVIKQNFLVDSDEVVLIPDLAVKHPELERNETWDGKGPSGAFSEEAAQDGAENAEELSRKILQSAHAEREKLIEQARQEAERLREQARQEGFAEGLEEESGRIRDCLSRVDEVLETMHSYQRRYMERYETELKHLALDIAEKILCKAVDQDKTALIELVRTAVGSIKNAEWISAEVSDQLPELVEWMENELAARIPGKQLDVVQRELPPGALILRTPEGVVDASVDEQIKNLRELFADMD